MALKKWSVSDLDPTKMFEVIPSQDPETGVRFSLPVPRWLDEDGNPLGLYPIISEANATSQTKLKNGIFLSSKKKTYRFSFMNLEDDSPQAVKIDGTGTVMFTGPTPNQAEKLRAIIEEVAPDLNAMTPNDLVVILNRANDELGLSDIYHSDHSDIEGRMHAYKLANGHPYFGSFLLKPVVSTCIFLAGEGLFDGPVPQKFEDGAFIELSGQQLTDVKKKFRKFETADSDKIDIKAKLVQKKVFRKTRHDAQRRAPLIMGNIVAQNEPIKRRVKATDISGMREVAPEFAIVQENWKRNLSETFGLYGYPPLETSIVQRADVLTGKGEDVGKEIYGLHRLAAVAGEDAATDLALRFDLTVPMARYVAQHFESLKGQFPFKRYEIGRVFRGERPAKGRHRSFYQCDIDVIDQDNLSLAFDVETPLVMYEAVSRIGIGNFVIGINNRKVIEGFCQGLSIDDELTQPVMRAMDKLDKIGEEGVFSLLTDTLKLDGDVADKCLQLATLRSTGRDIVRMVMDLGVDNNLLLEQGLEELAYVMDGLQVLPEGTAVANMSIVRGLDYYTGTVYEGRLTDLPELGAVMAGGRYANLTSNYIPQALPGVGISFGLTRVFAYMQDQGLLPAGRKTPTEVLVILQNEADRVQANLAAAELRRRGIPTEVYHDAEKYTRDQLHYANSKGIPYALFLNEGRPEIRDLQARDQAPVDIAVWTPPKLAI